MMLLEELRQFTDKKQFRIETAFINERESIVIPEGLVVYWRATFVKGKLIIHGKLIIGE